MLAACQVLSFGISRSFSLRSTIPINSAKEASIAVARSANYEEWPPKARNRGTDPDIV